jgi:hypothetical protein
MLYCDICFKISRYLFNCNHSYCDKCNKKSKELCLICNDKKEVVNFSNLSDDENIVYENLQNRLGLIDTSRDQDRIYFRDIVRNRENINAPLNTPLNTIFDLPNTTLFDNMPPLVSSPINNSSINSLFFAISYPINTVDLIYIPMSRR